MRESDAYETLFGFPCASIDFASQSGASIWRWRFRMSRMKQRKSPAQWAIVARALPSDPQKSQRARSAADCSVNLWDSTNVVLNQIAQAQFILFLDPHIKAGSDGLYVAPE
jgi:hypothetical protein